MSGIDWPGLLSWSSKYHDGTAPSKFQPLSAEDREFLENALQEAFSLIEDANKIMKEAAEQLQSPERTDASIQTALEVMDKCCDDPDVARNVEKLGGLQPLLDLLSTHPGPLRVRACEILALLFSNNPLIQEAGYKRGALPALFEIVKDATTSADDRSKAFRALVALIRHIEAYEVTFLREMGGFDVVLKAMGRQEDLRMNEKAVTFSSHLAASGRLEAQELSRVGLALAPTFAIADAKLQFKEERARCALELGLMTSGECPTELVAAVKARHADVSARKDPDEEPELEILKEIVARFEPTA